MSKYKELPSQEFLKECFDYNEITGDLIWKEREFGLLGLTDRSIKCFNSKYAGTIVGGKTSGGYIRFELFNKKYLAHRIIYQMCYSIEKLPDDYVIDHRDGNSSNNLIDNLKLATRIENGVNKKISCNNTSGATGIGIADNGKYTSSLRIDGKNIRFGTFDTLDEAVRARRIKLEERYNEKLIR
jgi:hypothetical protein